MSLDVSYQVDLLNEALRWKQLSVGWTIANRQFAYEGEPLLC